MKTNCRFFYRGAVMALFLLLASGPGIAGPGEKGKQKVAPPKRANAMPEVVVLREHVHPQGESVQSKKIRGAKKHPGKKGFRSERGLRSDRPQMTRNRIVVVPGEFSQIVEVRAVPPGKGKPDKGKPGKGKPDNGKPKGGNKSAKSAP